MKPEFIHLLSDKPGKTCCDLVSKKVKASINPMTVTCFKCLNMNGVVKLCYIEGCGKVKRLCGHWEKKRKLKKVEL